MFNKFKFNLRNAGVKLHRAVDTTDGIDPSSGYSTDEIVAFLVELPELGNEEQIGDVKSVLRRHGFADVAEDFVV